MLLVGYYEKGKLLFAAKVNQGLNLVRREVLLRTFEPLRIDKCPFADLPSGHEGRWGERVTAEEMRYFTWVRPQIVAEIKITEWTKGDLLRHAEFAALREDKEPLAVVRESVV